MRKQTTRVGFMRAISIEVVACLLVLATTAPGQTINNVNGSVADLASVTITGSALGTKSTPAPLLFSEFNEGIAETAVDSLVNIHGWQSWGAGDDDPARYSDDSLRDGAGMNCRFIYPDRISGTSLSDDMVREGLDINASDRVYMSMYIWSDFDGCQTFSHDPASPQQWKSFRLSRGDNGYPALVSLWHGSGVVPPGTWKVYSYTGNGAEDQAALVPSTAPADTGVWHQVEMEVRVNSSPGTRDGTIKAWFNGNLVVNETNWLWIDTGDNPADVWNSLMIGQYIQVPPRRYTVRYDDVYVDKSWARVILGDSSTFANCDVRELQIPTNWSANSVTVTVNAGSFQPGDTAYLYVVTSAGLVSNALGVEVGGDVVDPGPPGPPSAVEFQ